uniref:Decapping nuclease n=1 Tax=Caenorhabditis tropicalis TaxID=1561998 RepID=A0A1I7TUA1_9PELO
MDTRIRVENVDYYSFGSDLKAIPVSEGGHFPKELNGHKEYLQHSIRQLPLCNLNVKVPQSKISDSKIESLFDYIRQKGFEGKKPDFVTSKELLKSIASMESHMIHVCRIGGVIWIQKADREIPENYGRIFEHFMTRKQGEEMKEEGTNGVFKGTVIHGDKEWSILYSGKVDAVERTPKGNLRHYELKVSNGPTGSSYFYGENSCSHFWQSFFGASPSLIIGSRTDKTPFEKTKLQKYPKFVIYKIQEIRRESIPGEVSELPYRFQWNVEEGKKNIRVFLQLVKNHLKSDGDYLVFSRKPGSFKWNIRVNENTEFSDLVRKYVTV